MIANCMSMFLVVTFEASISKVWFIATTELLGLTYTVNKVLSGV